MENYSIDSNLKIVTGISNFRIPFEPKNEKLKFRNELREAISNLVISDSEILVANFYSSTNEFFDVENILIYNLGYSCFKGLTDNGFIVRYCNENICKNNIYEYKITNGDLINFPKRENILSFEYEMPKLNTSSKVHDHFKFFKSGEIKLSSLVLKESDNIGVYIEIETSRIMNNPINLMKPMIDGIISSLHFDNNLEDLVLERLEKLMDLPTEEIRNMFMENQYTILGKRNLVTAYRSGVKWNPEDEKCIEILIKPTRNNMRENIKVSGRVYKRQSINYFV